MKLSRREALGTAFAAGAVAALGGCAQQARRVVSRDNGPIDSPNFASPPDWRFLNRVSFGPRPGDLERLQKVGRDAYVDSLLRPEGAEEAYLTLQLHRIDILGFEGIELRDVPEDAMIAQLQQAAVLRAVYGRHQLQERMVDFWTDHFNVYGRKGLASYRKPGEDADIRRHALGSFEDLLVSTAHSPAMMMFLDNHFNLRGRPNENYGRELLELHTLGVDGGYTQKDVQEVARCFTGWGIETRFLRHKGSFRFDPDLHDDGEKVVLGQRYAPGGGKADGDRVLSVVANHAATARHLSRKLCRFFLGNEPPALQEQVAKAFRDSHGSIAAALRPILLSNEIVEGPPILKRPFDYVTSALRAVDATTDGGRPLLDRLASMGHRLYEWPMPDGYPLKEAAWTGTMLARWNFAFDFASDEIPGTRIDWSRLPKSGLNEVLLGPGQSIQEAEPREALATLVASPEFQWR